MVRQSLQKKEREAKMNNGKMNNDVKTYVTQDKFAVSDMLAQEQYILQSKRKLDSRRSKESRKSAGRNFSRHITANSDLLDLGLHVGEQVNEEDDEGASARLSKRHQNQSMLDLQKGKPLILDNTDDSSHNNDIYDQLSKSVLTPNMYGHIKSKRGNKESIVSTNPYIKFKKDKHDTSSVKSATFRNPKQSTTSSKKLQPSQQNALNKIIGEISSQADQNNGSFKQDAKQAKWPETDGQGDLEIDINRSSIQSSMKAQKEVSENKPETSVSYVSQMNMQDQLDQMFESSSLIVSPAKTKRKKMKSNQKSTRRQKTHISPRKKRINKDLEDLGQDFNEDDQIYEDYEEEEIVENQDDENQYLNEDLIGDTVVPQIVNQNFSIIQPTPTQKPDESKSPKSDSQNVEIEKNHQIDNQISKAEFEQAREKKKAMNNQKEQITSKLRQKLKKLNKQQDQGNKQFKEISIQIDKIFDKVRDQLDELQDKQIEKMRESQMIRNGIFNGVAGQIDQIMDQLGDEIEEEQQEDDDEVFDSFINFNKQSAEIDAQKETQFERIKLIAQECIEASETLINSEQLPKDASEEDNNGWQQPKYECASMPSFNHDQLERICQIKLDLNQFNCDSQFLSKAFSIETVDLQLDTVRENDFNRSFMSFRKKRKKSKNLTKSNKKQSSKLNSERLSDNLLSNYLVKQDTERLIPSNSLLMKSQMKSKRQNNLESTLISQRSLNKNLLKSQMGSPTKMKKYLGFNKQISDIEENEAKQTSGLLDLENQRFKTFKKPEKSQDTNRSTLKGLNQKGNLMGGQRAIQSIQQHVDRIQTGSSLETLNRNNGNLASLTQSQMLMKSTLMKQKTFSEITSGANNAYGSLTKSPVLSNLKNTPSYQFSKSGINSRSQNASKVILGLNQPATPFSHLQTIDKNKINTDLQSRRESVNMKNEKFIQYEKQAKQSVSQVKSPIEPTFQQDVKQFTSQISFNKPKYDNQKETSKNLTSTLENVQRLNDEIKNQSNELKKSTSFAQLEPRRFNPNIESGSVSRRRQGPASVNSIDVSLGENTTQEKNKLPTEPQQKEDVRQSYPKTAQKKSTSTWQWPWQSTKKLPETVQKSKTESKADANMQVISSSNIVRRDSSVGSAIRGLQGSQHEQESKIKPLKDIKGQTNKTQSRNNSRMSTNQNSGRGYQHSKQGLKTPVDIDKKKAADSPQKEVLLMQPASQEHQFALATLKGRYQVQRLFTKIIVQSDRVQFQWSHPPKGQTTKVEASDGSSVTSKPDPNMLDLQYILEYGCGVKFKGVEQFRKIYQGKAHKCIVADLMPSTTYRFRVRPIRIQMSESENKETLERGEWSEVVGVTTLSK